VFFCFFVDETWVSALVRFDGKLVEGSGWYGGTWYHLNRMRILKGWKSFHSVCLALN
jgi:hypothetical protein